MKKLALITLVTLQSVAFTFAQNCPNDPNQIQITTEFDEGVTELKWELNREKNSSYFLIERSFDGKPFEIITTLKAGSSTYQKTNYRYEDVESEEHAQYKVTLVLMDGSTLSTLSSSQFNEKLAEAIEQ